MNGMKNRLIGYRWLVLLGLTCGLFFCVSCKNTRKNPGTLEAGHSEIWTCSMHPEIIRDHPGNCPICGMVLVRKFDHAQTIHGIPLEELIQPANRYVVSAIPYCSLSVREIQPVTEAYGTVTYDTRQISTISARVSGRIEKIYVHYRYQHVMKGEHILDIYSPELQTAQQELLFLIRDDPANLSLIAAAKQKLLLLGMTDGELEQVIKTQKPILTVALYSNYSGHLHEAGNSMPVPENGGDPMGSVYTEELAVKAGMYIQKGQVVFQIFNTDKCWILVNIDPDAQKMVQKGNRVHVIPETDPAKAFDAQIDFIDPFFSEKDKTMMARIYFSNAQLALPVGSKVKAAITGKGIKSAWLPEQAVLSLGLDHIVFLKAGGGFLAHRVRTGIAYQGQLEILSGLSQKDSVAGNAQYLADSEGFIKANPEP